MDDACILELDFQHLDKIKEYKNWDEKLTNGGWMKQKDVLIKTGKFFMK